jgi:FKBP-type peptidyl-prolyl cis-trans isomerase FkpA
VEEEKSKVGFDTKKIVIGIAILVFAFGALFVLSSKPKDQTEESSNQEAEIVENASPSAETGGGNGDDVGIEFEQMTDDMSSDSMEENGLIIEDIVVGDGAEAKAGDSVTVNYIGTLTNGTKFDSSYDRNQPFTFNLGAGSVIKGWDMGVLGMKVGGKRKLTIPSDLGYGERGAGAAIPPNSILIFEVELLEVN